MAAPNKECLLHFVYPPNMWYMYACVCVILIKGAMSMCVILCSWWQVVYWPHLRYVRTPAENVHHVIILSSIIFFSTNVTSICTHSHALWTNTLNTFQFFFSFSPYFVICWSEWTCSFTLLLGSIPYTDERTNVWLCNCAYEYDIQQYDFRTLVCYTVLNQIYVWGKPTRSCCARF